MNRSLNVLFYVALCGYGPFLWAGSALSSTRFEEVSPLIRDIELKKGDPFIEVFISGMGHVNCYDAREYVVEKSETKTRIIPRLRRTPASKPCRLGLKAFRDKAADLDPQSPASYDVEVLGFKGWSRKKLSRE